MQKPATTIQYDRDLYLRGGFSFIEAAVALAIVSICLLTLLALHTTSINLADAAHQNTEAALLAEQKMAEILALGYPQTGNDSGTEKTGFKWRTEITDAEPPLLKTDITGLRKVTVDVTWNRGETAKNLRISSYIANRGAK
jgi:type II secretion system protein I